MTWQRIYENTYIDDTLVTCAEYQLFIDEMREEGKYYQPDHWTSYQFPKGQAREPILGVRLSDAVVFCKWLMKREVSEWKYRLPTQEETDAFPLKLVVRSPLGYWLGKKYQFAWDGIIPKNARTLDQITFARELTRDNIPILECIRDLARAFDLSRNPTSSFNSSLSLDLAHDLALNFAHYFTVDINSALSRTLALQSIRSLDLERYIEIFPIFAEMSGKVGFSLLRSLARARRLPRRLTEDAKLYHEVGFELDYGIIRARFLDIINTTYESYEVDLAFMIYIDIVTLQERIAGRSPAFEGIRLVKERTR